MKPSPKDVDEYIENAPGGSRSKLRELRAAIREIAPNAPERISYGMPTYGEKGRTVYFGIAKAHIGLYGLSARSLRGTRKRSALTWLSRERSAFPWTRTCLWTSLRSW
ncbi:MAG TPA: DUF1801 domain-containing protein [Methanomassiliicoccales archaeon]